MKLNVLTACAAIAALVGGTAITSAQGGTTDRIGNAMAWKAKHLPPEAPCVDNADHSVRTCPLPEARPAAAKAT